MTSKPPNNSAVAQAAMQSAISAATNNIIWHTPASSFARSISNQLRLYDYAYTPDHPALWHNVTTRDLQDMELFEVQSWLRLMTSGNYDTITHYTPAMRLSVYCERSQDAAMVKLVWGGK